ncbi:MAG TPA: heme ABC exporter ATP-binding protein CcmA [Gammaproteobacteria bacterium]
MTDGQDAGAPFPGLRVDGLAMWRGEQCLFESLDFALGEGQIGLVVGPNGAGKTTLLRVLAGLTPPSSGRVEWHGTALRALPPEQRAAIAYRGHADGLKRELTVRENLEFHRRMQQTDGNVERIAAQLRVGEKLDERVRFLSAGQRRRVGLGCLRLGGAKLWILDEPMTHLDAAGRALVAGWIANHVAADGIAVVATHRPDELARPGALVIEL